MIGLGISYQMHDSAACLVIDGDVVAAVAEERLSRHKHDSRFPARSIRSCLSMAGVSVDQLDYVALAWPEPHEAFVHDMRNLVFRRTPWSGRYALNSMRHFVSMQRRGGGLRDFVSAFGGTSARIHRVGHHLAHAISAYARSGFTESAVVVMDGRGAKDATTIWMARAGRLERVASFAFPR